MKKQNRFLTTAFSVYMVLFPILSLYIFVGSVTIGQAGLLLLISMCIINDFVNGKKFSFDIIGLLIYIIAVCLNTFIASSFSYFNEIILRNCLHILYYAVVFLFFKDYLNYKTVFKALRIVSLFSSLFLIFQWTYLRIFGAYIPGVIPFLKTVRTDMGTEFYNSVIGWYGNSSNFRVRSIFGEGAEFCQYVLCYLILIFDLDSLKPNIEKLVITLAVFLSASNLGVVTVIVLWLLYLLKTKSSNKLIFVLFFALIIVAVFSFTNVFDVVTRRLFGASDGTIGIGDSISGRVSGYSEFFNGNHSAIELIFGSGIISLENKAFMPSNLGNLVCFGIVGLAAYVFFHVQAFVNGNRLRRRFIIYFTIIGFIGNLTFYNFAMFTMLFIFSSFDAGFIKAFFEKRAFVSAKHGPENSLEIDL